MSPMASAGSSPPATPEKAIARQPNRSASNVVTSAALTFPIPEPASTTSWPSTVPVTNSVCAARSVWVCASTARRASSSWGMAQISPMVTVPVLRIGGLEALNRLDDLSRAFTDDHARCHGVSRRDARHDRAVGNPKTLDAVHAQAAVDDGHPVGAHFRGAALMPVGLGGVAHIVLQIVAA